MAANTSINLINLDFDTFRGTLRSYLQQQPLFKDYDFSGSNLSVLLDLLAYNTYQNAFYTNMVGNEMFLDSALQRDSIVSHAKELNYTPQSFRSARATIDVVLTTSANRSTVIIPKNTQFSTSVGSNSYTFSTNKTMVLANGVSGVFTANNVDIYEGTYLLESYVMNYIDENQRFVVSNPLIDTSSLSVVVSEDNNITQFTKAESLLGLNELSNIWFLQGAEKDRYEVLFGNNIFGRKPKNGSTILIEYRPSSGELPNGASSFSSDRPIDGVSDVVVNLVNKATGGSIYESMADIKYSAPRHYSTQERAVTANDYKILLEQQFPEINDLNVYGGEELSPPQYGRVFIAVDIFGFDGVPEYKKTEYKNWIKNKTPLTIEPFFVDPQFVYAKIDIDVKFNSNITDLSVTDINSRILASVNQFNQDNYSKFNTKVRTSKLLKVVDDTHPSIVSTYMEIVPYVLIRPQLGVNNNLTITFPFAIIVHIPQLPLNFSIDVERILSSTQFYFEGKICEISDDNNGTVRLVTIVGNEYRTIRNIGTINYDTGTISITNFAPQSFVADNGIKIYVYSESTDFTLGRNYFFEVKDEDVEVNIVEVKE